MASDLGGFFKSDILRAEPFILKEVVNRPEHDRA